MHENQFLGPKLEHFYQNEKFTRTQPNGEEIWNTALKEAAAKKGHHRFGFEI